MKKKITSLIKLKNKESTKKSSENHDKLVNWIIYEKKLYNWIQGYKILKESEN